MSKTKDMKRRERNVRLLERRLTRQRQLPGAEMEIKLTEATAQGYERGWKAGRVSGLADALEKTKEFKTITSLRRSLGALHRAARHHEGHQ